jgi:hypothetical protein
MGELSPMLEDHIKRADRPSGLLFTLSRTVSILTAMLVLTDVQTSNSFPSRGDLSS